MGAIYKKSKSEYEKAMDILEECKNYVYEQEYFVFSRIGNENQQLQALIFNVENII